MPSGATCSGKTTLAKHLKRILPDSVIIHQDVRPLSLENRPERFPLTYFPYSRLGFRASKSRLLPENKVLNHRAWRGQNQPQELVPIHPVYKVQDWDAAPGAITWSKLIDFLRHVKETGEIPPDHRSHDHLNEQKEIKVDDSVRDGWVQVFEKIKRDKEIKDDESVVWGLVDGFILYWNQVNVVI